MLTVTKRAIVGRAGYPTPSATPSLARRERSCLLSGVRLGREMVSSCRIAIVGGGLAGLGAQSLKTFGIETEVFEQAPALGEIGAEIVFSSWRHNCSNETQKEGAMI